MSFEVIKDQMKTHLKWIEKLLNEKELEESGFYLNDVVTMTLPLKLPPVSIHKLCKLPEPSELTQIIIEHYRLQVIHVLLTIEKLLADCGKFSNNLVRAGHALDEAEQWIHFLKQKFRPAIMGEIPRESFSQFSRWFKSISIVCEKTRFQLEKAAHPRGSVERLLLDALDFKQTKAVFFKRVAPVSKPLEAEEEKKERGESKEPCKLR